MKQKHELAGKTVRLNCADELNGQEFVVEDYWENIAGRSWMFCDGNPACIKYAIRSAFAGLPTDNNVVYGKVGGFGYIVHVSELGPVI